MTDKGSYPSTYTLSSGEAAKAELRELREVAEELYVALEAGWSPVTGKVAPHWKEAKTKADAALARYEALRDG